MAPGALLVPAALAGVALGILSQDGGVAGSSVVAPGLGVGGVIAVAGARRRHATWFAAGILVMGIALGAWRGATAALPAGPGSLSSLVAAGAYALSPIDLVPGIIPVAGQMDDLAALLIAIRFAVRMTPKEVAVPHLERADITPQQIDEDLKAVRDATIWLARRAASGVRNFAATNAHRVTATIRRLATRD